MTLPRLFLFAFLGALCWLILIGGVALAVSFMGWLNFSLGILVTLFAGLVARDIFVEEPGEDELGVPDWINHS